MKCQLRLYIKETCEKASLHCLNYVHTESLFQVLLQENYGTFNIPHFVELLGVLNYANTDLKIFLYVCLDIKIISCKFRVPNLKNF